MENTFNIITFEEKPISPVLIKEFIDPELAEPYSYITYYGFLYQQPEHTYMMFDEKNNLISILIGKMSKNENDELEGYIAMIVVNRNYRGKGIAKKLVQRYKEDLIKRGCFRVALETELINQAALRLYECNIKSIRILS